MIGDKLKSRQLLEFDAVSIAELMFGGRYGSIP